MKFLLCFLLSVSGALAASNVSVVYNSTNNTVVQTNLVQNFSALTVGGVSLPAGTGAGITNTGGIYSLNAIGGVQTTLATNANGQVTISTPFPLYNANSLVGNNTGSTGAGNSLSTNQVKQMLGLTNTGTGFQHITAGVPDIAAKTVDLSSADITGNLNTSHLNSGNGASSLSAWTGNNTWQNFFNTSGNGLIDNTHTFVSLNIRGAGGVTLITNGDTSITISNNASGSGGTTNWLGNYYVDTNASVTQIFATNDVTIIRNMGGGAVALPNITNVLGRVIMVKDNFGSVNLTPFNYPSSDSLIGGFTNIYVLPVSNSVAFLATQSKSTTNYNWEVISVGGPFGVTLTTSGGTPDFNITGSGTTALTINVANANGTGVLIKQNSPALILPIFYFQGNTGIQFKDFNDGITYMQLLRPTTGALANYLYFYDPSSQVDFFDTIFFQNGTMDFLGGLSTLNLGSTYKSLDFTNRLVLVGLTNQLSVRNFASNAPASVLESRWPVSKTTNYTIAALDSGTTFNNQGSSSNIILTLPATVAGQHFKFSQNTTDQIEIDAPSGSIIRAAGLTNNTFSLSHQGTIVDIEAVNTTTWFVLGQPSLIVNSNNQTAGVQQRINFLDTASVTVSAVNNTGGAGSVDVSFTAPGGALPSQSGQAGHFLNTDGTTAAWSDTITNNTLTLKDVSGSGAFSTVNLLAPSAGMNVNFGSAGAGADNFTVNNNTADGYISLIVHNVMGLGGGLVLSATDYSATFDGPVVMLPGEPFKVQHGSNQRAGNLTLSGGTQTVLNSSVTANTIVMLTRKTSGGTIGTAITYTVSAGTSFTVNSDNILDTSTFSYFLIEVP